MVSTPLFSVIKLFVLPIWILLGIVELFAIFELITQLIVPRFEEYKYLLIGFGSYWVIVVLFYLSGTVSKDKSKHREEFAKTLGFYDTLVHELSHLVFVFLTFSRPKEMTVFREASKNQLGRMGYVYSLKRFGFIQSHLISLAPYFFPFLTMILWGFYLMVKPERVNFVARWFTIDPVFHGLFFLIGFSYSYHLFKTFREAQPGQFDFKNVGYFYGLSFVFFMKCFFLLVIISTLIMQYGSFEVLIETISNFLDWF